jgi:hypothetical protein
MTVLRLDVVLEGTKSEVLAMKKRLDKARRRCVTINTANPLRRYFDAASRTDAQWPTVVRAGLAAAYDAAAQRADWAEWLGQVELA